MTDDARPTSSEPSTADEAADGAAAPHDSTAPSDLTDSTDRALGAPDRHPRRFGLMAAVSVIVVGIDQLTKRWALHRLPRGTIHVLGSLRLNLIYNKGSAFGMGGSRGLGPWIAVVAIVVVAVLAVSGTTSRQRWGAVAAGLIAGGAVGNLLDRAFRGSDGFLHGAVIDFIDLQWWPVFNVADAAICVGAVLLVLTSLRQPAD